MHAAIFTIAVFVVAANAQQRPAADEYTDLLEHARKSVGDGKTDEAIALCGKAVELAPKRVDAYILRARIFEVGRQHKKAVADLTKAIAINPDVPSLYYHRGSERLAAGDFKGSLADFDRQLKLKPAEARSHWKRGITCYYAGEFDAGRQQFEAYQKFDNADVENAVWRYLCMARDVGVEKARAAILTIGDDRRVPMRQIYDLYAGKATPNEVMVAVKSGEPGPAQLHNRLFYAHLYLGLYYDAAGKHKQALEHMKLAEKHRIGHYMWDVAKVHADVLRSRLAKDR